MRWMAPILILVFLAGCAGGELPTPERTEFTSPFAVLMLPAIASNAPGLNRLKGLGIDTGWNWDSPIESFNCGDAALVGAGWWHNWRVTNLDCPLGGFIPTVFQEGSLWQPLATTSGPIFGFNEPDIEQQANLWPVEAARLTAKMMTDYPDHDWIGATITWLHPVYYEVYLAELDRLGVSSDLYGLSLNCYDSTATCQAAVEQVREWADERGIETVWLKEFKYSDLDDALAFIAWLEEHNIYYAWFLARVGPRIVGGGWLYDSPLWDSDGVLTEHGEMYRSVGEWLGGL